MAVDVFLKTGSARVFVGTAHCESYAFHWVERRAGTRGLAVLDLAASAPSMPSALLPEVAGLALRRPIGGGMFGALGAGGR